MCAPYRTHFPADAIPRGEEGAGSSEQPVEAVVLAAFAKLLVMAGTLVLFTPAWLDVMAQLADGPARGALSVVAFVGGVGFLALAVPIVRVWAGLLKNLARAD